MLPEQSAGFCWPSICLRKAWEASSSFSNGSKEPTDFPGVQAAESEMEAIQSLIRHPANLPERMTAHDPLLIRDAGEQGAASLTLASHQRMGNCSVHAEVAGFFSELLRALPRTLNREDDRSGQEMRTTSVVASSWTLDIGLSLCHSFQVKIAELFSVLFAV